MALTKIGSIGINTGIQFAGVTTVSTLHVGSGVTLSSDGDVFFTGIATGDASGLTALNASALGSGTVPPTRLSGPYTNAIAGSATNATNFYVTANNSTDETVYPIFVDGATGNQGAETDTGLTYNPSTGNLTSTIFTGALTGNVTGNVTGNINNTTLLLQTGGTERARIDSGGRLLLGTTTEGHAAADELTIENTAADMGITLRSSTSHQGAIYFSDGTSGADEYRGIINYNHANDALSAYTNATERIRIDSTGRVLINTTALGNASADDLTIASTGAYTGITLRSDTDQGGALYFSDAESGSAQYDGFIYYSQDLRKMVFGTAQTNAMAIDSSGNIDATIGNIRLATSGKGIDFSATSDAGGMTSELLDDYEEGTFTPAFAMSTTATNLGYTTQSGSYTKIGNVVSVEMYLTINAINANGSGSLYLSGLPFTKSGAYGGLNISYQHGMNNSEITHALVDVNSTILYLYTWNGSSVVNANVATSFTVNTQLMFNGIYLAA